MKKYIFFLVFLMHLSCNYSPAYKNEYWPDGSPKILVSKIKMGNKTFTVKKYFHETAFDSLNFYKKDRFYENGKLAQVRYFDKNSLPYGEWKSWYENGQLSMIEHYTNGKRHGDYESWFPDGEPLEKFTYQNDSIINTPN
ncbi:hypothetical protein DR864_02895 [Runella rosea]|uniref:MORN repeat variant n=1 Tax=Runella rosea TaxID=2259595 RepID=A0A344TDN0_9BACT|nr:hypothetical protein [Runella rosea]AXE16751.1 hypothetical protein DR864_02895 [Runella rosea]